MEREREIARATEGFPIFLTTAWPHWRIKTSVAKHGNTTNLKKSHEQNPCFLFCGWEEKKKQWVFWFINRDLWWRNKVQEWLGFKCETPWTVTRVMKGGVNCRNKTTPSRVTAPITSTRVPVCLPVCAPVYDNHTLYWHGFVSEFCLPTAQYVSSWNRTEVNFSPLCGFLQSFSLKDIIQVNHL